MLIYIQEMRKYIPNILIGILMLAILIQSLFYEKKKEQLIKDVATEKQKVVEREAEVATLKIDKANLVKDKTALEGNVATLNVEISKSKAATKLIQKKRDEKLNNVDNIPSGQLQEYFTNRYSSGQVK